MKLHLVLYSNQEKYEESKKLLMDTVKIFTKYDIVVHDYTLERIKTCLWFEKISKLVSIDKLGKRDGYFNSWKPYIIKDVYEILDEDDILYYVDCSKYYITGFTESIDKLIDAVSTRTFIAGSVGNNVLNNSYECCDNIDVWNKINPGIDNEKFLSKMHVLNSWFILKKAEICHTFINEWVYFTSYSDDELSLPLVTYHHTVEQSIFNILAYKYGLTVFYHNDIPHDKNKDRNEVLRALNSAVDANVFFIPLI